MNGAKWEKFKATRKKFCDFTKNLSKSLPDVVYNTALNDVNQKDKIKLIIVADNPGKVELVEKKYLVGDAGTIAENFFTENPIYKIDDFRRNVIILNKTPIHSAYTDDLTKIKKLGKPTFIESQVMMACILFEFQKALDVPVWITGYGQMKKGVFAEYTEKLRVLYADTPKLREDVYVFGHFSFGWFARDVKKARDAGENFMEQLELIGKKRREGILG